MGVASLGCGVRDGTVSLTLVYVVRDSLDLEKRRVAAYRVPHILRLLAVAGVQYKYRQTEIRVMSESVSCDRTAYDARRRRRAGGGALALAGRG